MDDLFSTSRRHWWERVNNTVIESHLSVTSGSRRARTRIARLVDRDANDCAISLPPPCIIHYIALGVNLSRPTLLGKKRLFLNILRE